MPRACLTRLNRKTAAGLLARLPAAARHEFDGAEFSPTHSIDQDGRPVALAVIGVGGVENAALLTFLQQQGLRTAEQALLALTAALLANDEEADGLEVLLLPADGWCLPPARALGFSVDRSSSLPPRGVARMTATRYLASALTRDWGT